MSAFPEEIGVRPFGAQDHDSESDELNRIDPFRQAIDALRRGVRSVDFWLLAGSFFICGASTNGLIERRQLQLRIRTLRNGLHRYRTRSFVDRTKSETCQAVG